MKLQENNINIEGEKFDLDIYPDPVLAEKYKVDIVIITQTSITLNGQPHDGSVLIFRRGDKERGFCVEIDYIRNWGSGIKFYTIPYNKHEK